MRELEQEVLRLGIRAETAEEVLADAERSHEAQVRELETRVEGLQQELDRLKGGGAGSEKGGEKGRLTKLFGR